MEESRSVEITNERLGNKKEERTEESREEREGGKGPRVILRYHGITEQGQLGDRKLCTRLD